MAHLKAQGKRCGRSGYNDATVIAWLHQEHQGGRSLAELAQELNVKGVQTARGGVWHPSTVRSVLMRRVA
jgi:hypothetical protein